MINSLFTKKNRSANEWYFPSGKDLEKTSASDAYVETFSDNKLTSLAREICQNSLDAVVDVTKPVKVSFEIIEVDTKSIPGYSELCETIIPRAQDAWPEEEKTIKLLNKMKKILNREKISILKISDNNTTGLEKKNWESLIEQAGSSVKSSDESGGSFGIGKAAPFAISDLRMVFYSTLTSSNIDQSIGVFKFVSYGIKNGETTQGTGYCGENLKTPFDYGAPFDPKKRQETGTDIYVFGFNVEDFPNWEKEIILSILDNFLISVSNNKLEVLVNGSEVKKNSINDYILKIKNDKKLTTLYNDLISYYEVLQDGHRKEIKMPGFKKLDIADGEATLILSNNFTNNRRVLMTRKAGMKIFDKKNISGIIQFSGVFCATGPKINKFLKELENPKHDKWSVDRSSDKKVADEFLKFIYSFIKDSVNKYYKEEIMDQVDAYGVKDFLPNDLNEIIKSDSEKVEKSLLGTKTKVKLKKIVQSNNNIATIRSEEKGPIIIEEISKVDSIDGETNGFAYNSNDGTVGNETNKAGGSEDGNTTNVLGEELSGYLSIARKKVSDIQYRVIEHDSSNGIYKLVLKPNENLENIKIDVSIIGDSGNKSKVNIVSANSNDFVPIFSNNTLFIKKINANKWQTFEVKISQFKRLKLEVEVYANSR